MDAWKKAREQHKKIIGNQSKSGASKRTSKVRPLRKKNTYNWTTSLYLLVVVFVLDHCTKRKTGIQWTLITNRSWYNSTYATPSDKWELSKPVKVIFPLYTESVILFSLKLSFLNYG
jgi:hypothetical protein